MRQQLVKFFWLMSLVLFLLGPATAQLIDYSSGPVTVDGDVVAHAVAAPSVGCRAGAGLPDEDLITDSFLSNPSDLGNLIDCLGAGTSPPVDVSYEALAQTRLVQLSSPPTPSGCVRMSEAQCRQESRLELSLQTTSIQVEGQSQFDHYVSSSTAGCDCLDPIGCTNTGITRSRIDGDIGGPPLVIEIPFAYDQDVEVLVSREVLVSLDPASMGTADSTIEWEIELVGIGIWDNGPPLSAGETEGPRCVFLPAIPGLTYIFRVIHQNNARTTPTNSVECLLTENTLLGNDCFEVRLEVLTCRSADINGDGVVSVVDLNMLLSAWGPCPGCPEDVNGDGVVNVADLLIVLSKWGPCPTC